MRTSIPFFLALLLLLSSCSYRQFGAVATGSSLGGMLGSSIGGLMGGYRGVLIKVLLPVCLLVEP